jgi:hypothetical protein
LIEDLCTTILVLHRGKQLLYERLSDLRARLAANGQQETLEDLFFRLTEGEADEKPGRQGDKEAV